MTTRNSTKIKKNMWKYHHEIKDDMWLRVDYDTYFCPDLMEIRPIWTRCRIRPFVSFYNEMEFLGPMDIPTPPCFVSKQVVGVRFDDFLRDKATTFAYENRNALIWCLKETDELIREPIQDQLTPCKVTRTYWCFTKDLPPLITHEKNRDRSYMGQTANNS